VGQNETKDMNLAPFKFSRVETGLTLYSWDQEAVGRQIREFVAVIVAVVSVSVAQRIEKSNTSAARGFEEDALRSFRLV